MELQCICHQNEVLAAGRDFNSQRQTVKTLTGDFPLGHVLISYLSALRGQSPAVQEGLNCVLFQVYRGYLFCVPFGYVQACPQR